MTDVSVVDRRQGLGVLSGMYPIRLEQRSTWNKIKKIMSAMLFNYIESVILKNTRQMGKWLTK